MTNSQRKRAMSVALATRLLLCFFLLLEVSFKLVNRQGLSTPGRSPRINTQGWGWLWLRSLQTLTWLVDMSKSETVAIKFADGDKGKNMQTKAIDQGDICLSEGRMCAYTFTFVCAYTSAQPTTRPSQLWTHKTHLLVDAWFAIWITTHVWM